MKQSWVLFLFLAIFASPLHGASDQPRRGGTLTLAVRRDLVIMNPLVGTRSTEQAIRDLMYDALLGIDLKGNVQPKLAERWEISRDGKVYTFYLRRGVKFHDGREMNSEDVKFAMDYTMNPKNGAYGTSKLALVEKVEIVDRATLRVTMKKPSPAFLFSLAYSASYCGFKRTFRSSTRYVFGKQGSTPASQSSISAKSAISNNTMTGAIKSYMMCSSRLVGRQMLFPAKLKYTTSRRWLISGTLP